MSPLEQDITEEMRRRAAAMAVPVPPVDHLVEDGEAAIVRKRRRAGFIAATAAAAAIAAIVIGPAALRHGDAGHPAKPGPTPTHAPTPTPDRGPQSLDDLPEGPPPTVPYLSSGALHVDGVEIAASGNDLLAAGATVLVGRMHEASSRWWLLVDGDLVPVPILDDVFGPHLSARGDLLVWTSYPDTRTTRVTAWDPATQREIGHVDLDAAYAECCGGGQQIELLGVDRSDTVYWTDAADRSHHVHAWRPGKSAPTTAGGLREALSVLPSPPVASFADALPEDAKEDAIVRESETAVLVDAFIDPKRHYVLRCSTTTHACERTLPAGPISSWVFPAPTS